MQQLELKQLSIYLVETKKKLEYTCALFAMATLTGV